MTVRTAFLSIAIIRAPPRNRLPHAKQLVITGILPLTQAAVKEEINQIITIKQVYENEGMNYIPESERSSVPDP